VRLLATDGRHRHLDDAVCGRRTRHLPEAFVTSLASLVSGHVFPAVGDDTVFCVVRSQHQLVETTDGTICLYILGCYQLVQHCNQLGNLVRLPLRVLL